MKLKMIIGALLTAVGLALMIHSGRFFSGSGILFIVGINLLMDDWLKKKRR